MRGMEVSKIWIDELADFRSGRENGMMRLRIWVDDGPLPGDMDERIYTDIELRFDLSPRQMQLMALDTAQFAQRNYDGIPNDTNMAETEKTSDAQAHPS